MFLFLDISRPHETNSDRTFLGVEILLGVVGMAFLWEKDFSSYPLFVVLHFKSWIGYFDCSIVYTFVAYLKGKNYKFDGNIAASDLTCLSGFCREDSEFEI